jgi:hypothetical protein
VKTPNVIDITTAQSISVLGNDNTTCDGALEALTVTVSKAMVPERTSNPLHHLKQMLKD